MNQMQILLKEFSYHPIAYFPIYGKITGSMVAGVLLSQLIYHYYRGEEAAFHVSDKKLCEELVIGLYELKAAKKRLQELSFVTIERRGTPARSYYLLNIEIIITHITSYGKNPQLDMGKTHNLSGEKPITNYIESIKEREKKENMQNGKRSADTRISYILKEWYPEMYRKQYGYEPITNFGKDGKTLKDRFALLDKEIENREGALEALKLIIQYVHAAANSPKPVYPFTGGIAGISGALQAERFNEARKRIAAARKSMPTSAQAAQEGQTGSGAGEGAGQQGIPRELQERLAMAMKNKDREEYSKVREEIEAWQNTNDGGLENGNDGQGA